MATDLRVPGLIRSGFTTAFLAFLLISCAEEKSLEFDELERRAAAGDVQAMLEVSEAYHFGETVEEDLQRSFQYAQLAADTGSGDGIAALAEMYSDGIFVETDHAKAFQLLQEAAIKKSARGQNLLGLAFDEGIGTESNLGQANYWYTEAIANGDEGPAHYNLGINTLFGMGRESSVEEAIELFEAAIGIGYVDAHYMLGEIYQYGWGVAQNLSLAQYHYQQCSVSGDSELDCKYEYARSLAEGTSSSSPDVNAALERMIELGNSDYLPAIRMLGTWYDEGFYVPRDDEKAVFWFEKGAAEGDGESLYLLATMFEFAEGVDLDFEKALELYWSAVEQLNVDAMMRLAHLFTEGAKLERDLVQAEELWTLAAENDSLQAMAELAKSYELGLFGRKDIAKSEYWLQQVAELGDESSVEAATRNLERIRQTTDSSENKYEAVNFGKYFALVVGVGDYEHLQPLRTSIADARDLSETLSKGYGFEVETLENPTREEFLDRLISFRAKLGRNDNFLLFYAGHGTVQERTNRGFWQLHDADVDFETNWVSVDFVSNFLKTLDVGNLIVIADSCYSGAVFRSDITTVSSRFLEPVLLQRLIETPSRVALTSGGMEPVVDSLSSSDSNSIFSSALLKVLNDPQQIQTGSDVFSRVASEVIGDSSELGIEQTPEYAGLRLAGHEGGDFIFRRVSNKRKSSVGE